MLHPHSKEDLEPPFVLELQPPNSKANQDKYDQAVTRGALQSLNASRENELSHIAHELRDDICRRLALLSFRIEKTTKDWAKGKKEVGDQLEQIWQQCSALMGDVHALSHTLHPSILDNLGLVRAVRSFCREITDRRGVAVEFTHSEIPDSLPSEVSLSLFRLLQEFLHHAVKYCEGHRLQVNLKGDVSGIELEICHHVVGFDVATVWSHPGLGLISTRERIQLQKGSIHIQSRPNDETRILVWIPLPGNSKALARTAN
ncbi:MAG TPA: ATP-binding protein [Candidatus Acidoferrum sp.]|nr:ATP-binding protein [Candidatus Acidoferrum sp.]